MKVLVLTGTCGVGKSTIARLWAERHQGAIIDCDYFTEWILDPDFPHWSEKEEKLTARITAKVAQEYLDFGFNVAIDNVWSPMGFEYLKKTLGDVDIKFVFLHCDLEENEVRDRLRIQEHQMGDRVGVLKAELEAYDWPEYVKKIDSTGLSVEETLSLINS